jgi:saccharopine dehydrogenase-like NADP-dependent oxidoreductase
MKVQVNIRSMSTSVGMIKNGEVVDLPEEEIKKIIAFRPNAVEILEAESKPKKIVKKAIKAVAGKKKRARNKDGTLKADDPSTPDVNEAWENG